MYQWRPELLCIMALLQNSYVTFALSGVLLGIGFVLPWLWFVGVLGGALFLYQLQRTQKSLDKFLGAWLAWTVKAAFPTSIFWSVYPIDWLPIEFGNIQVALIFMYWSTAALWLGSGALVVALYLYVTQRWFKKRQTWFYAGLPLVWVLSEVFGSVVFSIMMLGPGGTINASYSLGYVGYLLAENPTLLLLAKVGGVYVLSFAFVVLALVVLFAIRETNRKYRSAATAFLLVVVMSGFIIHPANHGSFEGYRVHTIDTRFGRGLLDTKAKEQAVSQGLQKAMEAALINDPDYIILPEGAQFFDQAAPDGLAKSRFKFTYDSPEVVVVDSGRALVDEKTVVQATVYNQEQNSIEKVQKRYLVPQGEFMPTLYQKILELFGYRGVVEYIAGSLAYEVGPETDQTRMSANIPGILFCFESVSPYGVQIILNEKLTMPFVAHPVSHAWFHDSKILWQQLDTMLKVQAMWGDVYIVSAGNYVASRVISPNGLVFTPEPVAAGEGWVVREVIIPKVY